MTHEIRIDRLQQLLTGCRYGTSVHYVDETDSTQNLAHQLLKDGAGEGLLVLAETQTSGRGRLGRSWFSPPGSGVYMSLVLQPRVPHRFMPQLTIVAAAALCRVLRRLTHADIRIKWPNDLYVDDRKISGILLESGGERASAQGQAIVMGVGISVNASSDQYPEWLQDKASSLLTVTGTTWEREHIIAQFLHELEQLIDLYRSEGFAIFRTLWEAFAWIPEAPVVINTNQGPVIGTPVCIDEDGALVVELESGKQTTVYSGDFGA